MAKLKLQPDPTFKAKVEMPVPGAAPVDLEFTFKYRTKSELQAFIKASVEREDDAQTILEMATGWELTDPFSRESIDMLVSNYITAPRVIFDKYVEEHMKVARKN